MIFVAKALWLASCPYKLSESTAWLVCSGAKVQCLWMAWNTCFLAHIEANTAANQKCNQDRNDIGDLLHDDSNANKKHFNMNNDHSSKKTEATGTTDDNNDTDGDDGDGR